MIKLGVKKDNQTIPIFNINNSNTKDIDIDLIKTTNVNILLNRVRLDKKKLFRRKIFFVTLLGILVGSIIIFTII